MSNPFDSTEPTAALTVSQLNRQAKSLLESHFDFVWVEGELSNFARPSSGHWYFSLKDGDAQVRCAMFKGRNQRLRFQPDSGDAVRLRARVSLYEGRGEFQLIVEHMEPSGAGALQLAFERLKAKLQAEGLFAAARKIPIPDEVRHLGVITSPSGAAIHDILTVLGRRSPSTQVSLLPVPVQGESAAGQIATAIDRANEWHKQGKVTLDALIVGRGGGSQEDLWAFNEEVVARAIAASAIPIVSAVGHEVDFSIADLVADHRAATPSAAAELLSQDQQVLRQQLLAYQQQIIAIMQRQIGERSAHLGHLKRRLRHPGSRLQEQGQRLDGLEQRMVQAAKSRLRDHRAGLTLQQSRLLAGSPAVRLRQLQSATVQQRRQLESLMEHRLQRTRERIVHLSQVLDSLSPLRVLDRGYAILSDSSGRVITEASAVVSGDVLRAKLAKGELELEVKKTRD